jgi:hypothetical protein
MEPIQPITPRIPSVEPIHRRIDPEQQKREEQRRERQRREHHEEPDAPEEDDGRPHIDVSV